MGERRADYVGFQFLEIVFRDWQLKVLLEAFEGVLGSQV